LATKGSAANPLGLAETKRPSSEGTMSFSNEEKRSSFDEGKMFCPKLEWLSEEWMKGRRGYEEGPDGV
jgi:hypothetical protein